MRFLQERKEGLQASLRACLHCGNRFDSKAWICPECGKVQHPEVPTTQRQTEPTQVEKRKGLTKRASDDRLLGSIIAVLIPVFNGFVTMKLHLFSSNPYLDFPHSMFIAFSANIVLWFIGYLLLRPRYPDMGDAFRNTALVLGIGFPLGAFGNCLGLGLGSLWGGQ
jgi:hypothetical protein